MDNQNILNEELTDKNVDKYGNTIINENEIIEEEIIEEENIEDEIDEIDEETLILLHKLRMEKQDKPYEYNFTPENNKPVKITIDKSDNKKKSIPLQEFIKSIPDEEIKTSKFVSSRVESKRKHNNNNIIKRQFSPRKPPMVFVRNNNIIFKKDDAEFPLLNFKD